MNRCPWLILLAALCVVGPVAAASNGVISGRVVNRSDAEAAASVASVNLSLFAPQIVQDGVFKESVSDDFGAFVFRGLDTEAVYILGARFEGIPYITGELRFEEGQEFVETNIEVFDKASTDEGIRFPRLTMFVDRVPDTDDFSVRESIIIENGGGAYMSSRFESPTLRVRLPHGARELQVAEGLLGGLAEIAGSELVYRGPIYPGSGRIFVGYVAPAVSFRDGFVRHLNGDVDALEIHVGAGVPGLSAEDMEWVGRSTAHGGGYETWQGTGFRRGSHVTLRFSGSEVGGTGSSILFWIVLGGMILLVVAYLALPIIRPEEARSSEALDALENERFRAFDAVRELDQDHEMGKLSDEDHAEMRGILKARAIDVMARMDAAETVAATADHARPVCTSCKSHVGPQDRFCGQCGVALGAAEA